MDDLAQRVAELVETADSDKASAELSKLRDAVERTSLFTESLSELGSLTSKQSTGTH
jgi:hypothetical protein